LTKGNDRKWILKDKGVTGKKEKEREEKEFLKRRGEKKRLSQGRR